MNLKFAALLFALSASIAAGQGEYGGEPEPMPMPMPKPNRRPSAPASGPVANPVHDKCMTACNKNRGLIGKFGSCEHLCTYCGKHTEWGVCRRF
ncbi:hypothetical protein CF327_g4026 [Tilletia walkeri]|uniref:Uncharacterized protein n=1 Tax=Tilletia walkeri TaxID=117179 RepID=A0A8X7N601_9BASI|nr:hypothetical protein CF327_g4026 [Tilletia walkeri]KAE8266185.1 hypothetical protein A4X09_0g6162 [Tilletia walkeri]